MRNAFIEKLYNAAKSDKNIMLVTGDLGFGVLDKFARELPQQFVNAGISEQNMMGMAAGMAKEGKKVFIYSIANFPTMRCLEQIRNDCAYNDLNVKIISVGAGFSYGYLGMSHHITEDIAVMSALPGVDVYSPADKAEAEKSFDAMLNKQGVAYVRLGKGKENDIHPEGTEFDISKPCLIKDGDKELVLTTGAIIEEAISAREKLGGDLKVYSVCRLKPIDKEAILDILKGYKRVFTLEEHSVIGGLGSIVGNIIAEEGLPVKVIKLGLKDIYSSKVGDQKYLRKLYGMDSDALVTEVLKK